MIACTLSYAHSQTHTQSYFSAVYQIWAYSSLVMSIYSRVHLGEPKLIEVHHNGLFISYWTDRPTPSLSLSLALRLSLSRQQTWRETLNQVGAGQCLLDYGGLKVIFVPSKWIQNLVYSGPQAGVFASHLHTYTLSYIHTDQHKPWYTFELPKLPLFRFTFILNLKLPFFLLFFFLLLDIFKSSNSHTTQSFGLSFCPPPPHPLSSISAFLASPSVPWQDENLDGYSQAEWEKSYKATIKEQSMRRWPEPFIKSRVRKITALHWADQLGLQTITPMV